MLQARRPQRQGYCRQFIASSDKTRTHSSHFGSLIESSTRKEALVPALVCYVHFPWRWAWGRRACSTFKFPQTLTCEKPSPVVWLATGQGDWWRDSTYMVNSLSVESVSAVRVSLRELVSAAIVHKRERVQGVMRV